MGVVEVKAGKGQLTDAGKHYIARAMFDKGRSFVGGGLLVRGHEGNEYVALHLVCQGLEAMLKAVLLAVNHDEWQDKIRRMPIRHDLVALADTASRVVGLAKPQGVLRAELVGLNDLYKQHRMRFGTVTDIFIDAKSVPSARVLRRTAAFHRLVMREGL